MAKITLTLNESEITCNCVKSFDLEILSTGDLYLQCTVCESQLHITKKNINWKIVVVPDHKPPRKPSPLRLIK